MITWYPRWRLMKLSRNGRVYEVAHGKLEYLLTLGAKARSSRGRQWIELSTSPATVGG